MINLFMVNKKINLLMLSEVSIKEKKKKGM